MPLIREQLDTFDELRPFVKMTVAPNGVTVGDLAFVSAQTHWSTAIAPIATDNTVPSDLALDMFQSAIGDTGQGFSTSLTRGETSWLDSAGRLPANQVFVAIECGWQAYLRSSASTTDKLAVSINIPSIPALQAIGQNLSWDVTVGDGITRTVGSIGAYGGLGGVTGNIPWLGQAAAGAGSFYSAIPGARGAQLGDPNSSGVRLRVPLVFPPNINVRIKVRNGNGFTTPNCGSPTADLDDQTPSLPGVTESGVTTYLAFRQYLRGYLCTMPV